jgi:hypothetical protein
VKRPRIEYLAGLFDGEGCVYVQKRNTNFILYVEVAQVFKNGARFFQRRFGGGMYPQKGKRVLWHWKAWGEDAKRFLRAVLPHLHEKRPQARLAVCFPIARPYTKTAAQLARQEYTWAELRRLKRAY